ncbi:protein tis11 [Anaeramoeba flamelloides]|uniref:Protein tis11 n=1 Tax=Anaeramoeba flamelloides TaxID=1746091 RepID=A0AAV7ZLF9_9EUKA|nr:protein tis11 [Anaeramoeba flamelloides]|eukprot:Anaeramoba_flamelloidesa89837_38.p1 GENE.a89837_38~~a89837_38.p1  ORF type:complete len:169 (-),score=8.54 a89837_38:55-561(-)
MSNNNEPILVGNRILFGHESQNNFNSLLQREKEPIQHLKSPNKTEFFQISPILISQRSSHSSRSLSSHQNNQIISKSLEPPNHSHGRHTQNLKYKTEVCRNFFGEDCVCEFGKRCNFIHFRNNPESIALGSTHALKLLGLSNRIHGICPNQTQRTKKRLRIFRSLVKM